MYKLSILLLIGFCLLGNNIYGQRLWTGPKITISKGNFADWTLAENQDRITDSVWITRASEKGLFNIVVEEEYDKASNSSPKGTRWARGSISDGIENLSFGTWLESNVKSPFEEINVNKVLHLIADDIYIDITIKQWTQGGGGSGTTFGGGFSYERSTDPTLYNEDLKKATIRIYPNPVSNFIQINGLEKTSQYQLFDHRGQKVLEGNIQGDSAISIQELARGLYLLIINGRFKQKILKV